LSRDAFKELSETATVPSYDPGALRAGIVHFGVGNFHRAHQAVYLDDLFNLGVDHDWGLIGAGVRQADEGMRQKLMSQDWLTTVVEQEADVSTARVTAPMIDHLKIGDSHAIINKLADPAIRIVSLTITEGGYYIDPATQRFDPTHPDITADAKDLLTHPRTVFGLILAGLKRRRDIGIEPFTVMSCDNLPDNGDVAKRMICAFARLKDPDLADWMEANVAFPNSMVDRITPVTTEQDIERLTDQFGVTDLWPVVCEPFSQWVLEDRFTQGRPPLEDAGVQLVEDVVPYELMKLRLLNASHQALCYLGYLSGYRYAHEVCQDPLFVDFLLSYMDREATPTLHDVPGVDLTAYKHQLIERFANPEVRDTLARLCAESSDRIPKWLVPVIRTNLEKGGEIERSALVVASWARYAEGVDEHGDAIQVVDQLKDRVMAAAARQQDEPLAFIEDEQLFGDLAANERFAETYTRWLASLHDVGARLTLERLAGRADSVHD